MANPTGKGGNRFKKGQSGNPGGRRKEDKTIAEFKATSYKDFIDKLQKYGSLTREEMKQELARPGATMFELVFGKIILAAAQGEKDARQVLLERLWGKVKEMDPPIATPIMIIERSDGSRVLLGAKESDNKGG